MDETNFKVLIDKDLRPAYYDNFQCIAADCRLSCCCFKWEIPFNKKDYLAIKHQKGTPDLNARLERGLRRLRKDRVTEEKYGEFVLPGGVCPLLRDGLCALQQEKGASALPKVCLKFPRSENYSPSGYFERSLSTGCEAVLALLWDLPGGIDFVSDPLPENQHKNRHFLEDSPFLPYFQDIRSLCIDFLQDRALPMPQRILLMGAALKELAEHPEDCAGWLVRTAALLSDSERAKLCAPLSAEDGKELSMCVVNNLRILKRPEYPDSEFEKIRTQALTSLQIGVGKVDIGKYRTCRERLNKRMAGREWFWENLAVTLFFYQGYPTSTSAEKLWKSYVNFCNIYSFLHFMAVMSCQKETAGESETKAELFRYLVLSSRVLLHDARAQVILREELFQHESATLAHMAILLSG